MKHLSILVLLALVGAVFCELPEAKIESRRARLSEALAAKLDKLDMKPELKAEMQKALASMQETLELTPDQAKQRREEIRKELMDRVAKEVKTLRGH